LMAAAGATPAGALINCECCGVHGVKFKRCSICKEVHYCGAECQKADWKRHKKKCAPPVSLVDVVAKINAAGAAGDFRGVLQCEGHMEELMAFSRDDRDSSDILDDFCKAHRMGWQANGSEDHARSYVALEERRIPLLEKLQRFHDQGEAMCNIANILRFLQRNSEAATWDQRARDVGAAHGFFSLESTACEGLGTAAMEEGRHEQGVALLRNALVAADLNELDHPKYALIALQSLVEALFTTNSIDEAEPLVLRHREAAQAVSEKEGFCFMECDSLLFSARLHEVLCIYPAFGNPFPRLGPCFLHSHIASDCHRFHRARDTCTC